MKNAFEGGYAGKADNREQNQSKRESGDLDIERIADVARKLRQFATDFEEAIEPTVAMTKKGDKANWIDTANALYAAGKFALPRIMKGVDTLDEYFKSRDKQA